jgi:oligoendopeptidase F
MTKDISAKGIRWDLSDIYKSIHDPKIARDKREIQNDIKQFSTKCKGKIGTNNIKAIPLLKAIQAYEKIWERTELIAAYASYLHSIDTQDEKIGRFYQDAHELESNVAAELTWFEIEILSIPDKHFTMLQKDPQLARYAEYLKNVRKYKPHTLTEAEEIIMTKKDQTGLRTLIRLYDEVDASNTYELIIGSKKLNLNYSGLIPYLTAHPDRKIREKASKSLTHGLKSKEKLYAFTMNNLLNDKKIRDEIRHYAYPQEASFLGYGVRRDTVETMVESIQKGYKISERYYTLKRKAMKVPTLHEWDRYSYLGSVKSNTYTFEEAKDIVLTSYSSFSPTFSEIAVKFFNNKWIDAEIQPHKRAGAYCSYNIPSLHPYILLNYAGQIRDVTTLAHELGHGIHGYLSSKNTMLQAWPSTVIAEVASIFAEMIVFESIYKSVRDKKVKLQLLTEQLQSIFASVFRQNAFYLFESDMHNHRREKGELSIEDFNAYFQDRLQAMFGNGLTLTADHAYWWMPILHFYKYNFYVFSYSFGQMLSIALYARYQKEGSATVADYIKALSLGGSKDPYQITKTMGVDITNPKFWGNGLDYIETLVTEFETLTNS